MDFDSPQKYNEHKVDVLRESLKIDAEAGNPRYFEIRLDDISVVPRGNDYTKFDSYKNDLFAESNLMDVFIYSTNPNNFKGKKHRFLLNDPMEKTNRQELSGLEIDAKILAAVAQERERSAFERTKEELQKTKDELRTEKDKNKVLQEENDVFKSKKMLWGNVNIAEALGMVTETIVRRNTHIIAKIPGGKALAGIIEQDNKASGYQIKDVEDAEVTFEKTNSKINLTEDQQKFMLIMEALEENFDENELVLINKMLQKLLQNKEDLKIVAELLEITSS